MMATILCNCTVLKFDILHGFILQNNPKNLTEISFMQNFINIIGIHACTHSTVKLGEVATPG